MTIFNDCYHCGLPTPICSCKTPDSVYYQVETIRHDINMGRDKSPEENMSHFDLSEAFVKDYMLGRNENLYPHLKNLRTF